MTSKDEGRFVVTGIISDCILHSFPIGDVSPSTNTLRRLVSLELEGDASLAKDEEELAVVDSPCESTLANDGSRMELRNKRKDEINKHIELKSTSITNELSFKTKQAKMLMELDEKEVELSGTVVQDEQELELALLQLKESKRKQLKELKATTALPSTDVQLDDDTNGDVPPMLVTTQYLEQLRDERVQLEKLHKKDIKHAQQSQKQMKDQLLTVTKENTALLFELASLRKQLLKLSDDIKRESFLGTKNMKADTNEADELAKLMKLKIEQENEIELLKLEIKALKSKCGT
eukprot:scaffold1637_cov195-Alexandrium_tamarense.AAC.9